MNIKELQTHWDAFGRTDPLYAILTVEGKEGHQWNKDEFFASGKKEIDDLLNYLRSLNLEVPRNRALDFGCGVGRLTQSLADHFTEASGVDIARSMIQLAAKYNQRREKCRYYINQSDDLKQFKNNEFDFIYSNITLQHMAPRYSQAYIKEFLRVLSPSGLLVFQLPEAPDAVQRNTLTTLLKSLVPTAIMTAYRTLRYGGLKPVMQMYGIKKEQVRKVLEDCGGEIVSIRKDPMGEEGWVSYLYVVRKSTAKVCHFITGEYPPEPGGVSDYTHTIATGLAAAGDKVHVWCPPAEGAPPHSPGVFVHRELGDLAPADFRRVDRLLNQFAGPRRLLVQWIPHGYGYRAMNLMFCLWLWRRARREGDEVELMVHEPYLSFGEGSWKQNLVACVHRLMTIVLLRATRRVWVSIPAWEQLWRPYTLGRTVEFRWLPVGNNIPVVASPVESQRIRVRFVNDGSLLIGHLGAYDAHTTDLLFKSVPQLVIGQNAKLLLLGHGSKELRAALAEEHPQLADRVHATGSLDAHDLSHHISACDLMLQPYIDGVSSRRTSTMTALAHGVPVVTTAGKFTEPLWTASDAVALAPANNVDELVRSAAQLLPNEMAKQRLAAAAKKLYEEHFHPRRTIDALRERLETS